MYLSIADLVSASDSTLPNEYCAQKWPALPEITSFNLIGIQVFLSVCLETKLC